MTPAADKPDLLVLQAMAPPEVMASLAEHFQCHLLYQVVPENRAALLYRLAPCLQLAVTSASVGMDEALLAQLPALRMLAVYGVGLDRVPLDALARLGVAVSNTPDVLTDDVADLAVLLTLAAARRLPQVDAYVRAGQWGRRAPLALGRGVGGKVAGIYGFGRIGQAVAHRMTALGMRVCYHQPRRRAEVSLPYYDSLLALAEASDYLLVCAPGRPETRHAVNAEVLAALGREGTLVNVARGSVVDEAALLAALQQGRLGAAALDVFEDEPHPLAALLAQPNVVLTPHIGSMTLETRSAMGRLVLDNLLAYIGGRPLLTPVSPD
ncbi:2-hydroxyacid dehydrogenase [Chitinimonas sp.]|uniref:2-hydroxyacid dehydrogenase n=1 Tax=Chitinimonas sp. TaxID=1934313 RepID=UPI002F953178